MSKGSNGNESIAEVAAGLEKEVSSFESLTARIERLELTTQKNLLSAAELLQQATESHTSFLEHLRRLIEAVESMRARQNDSAATLSRCAARLDEQRIAYESLQQRFKALGDDARDINQIIVQDGASAVTAHERLSAAVETASTLVADARAAHLVDLERQADSLHQQLQSLAHKLRHIQSRMT